MRVVTAQSRQACEHGADAQLAPSQRWVTVEGAPILVGPDPEGRTIVRCPNIGPAIKPCTITLPVREGHSALIRINGQPVCLETVCGFTDGTPPGIVRYTISDAAQQLVRAGS